jgi:ABC-type transport system substrate-binding protein/DNA-binding SARP family transcriptional activator
LEFRILGDIEVRDQGRVVALGGPKQRALLAILLLRANETVSRDRLIDELWGERPPARAGHTLDSSVHRLRRALGPDGAEMLRTRGSGYQLQVAAGALDLDLFQRLAADGARALENGSYERAANKLAAALAIWRGPPLADLDHEPFARVELDRLEELRLTALEDRIEADLALGRHTSTVAELQALVAEHPLREVFRSQLMLALYRSGRQADALDVYQEAREYMVGELGIEPGKRLQSLHNAILRQDDTLESEPGGSSVLTEVIERKSPTPPPPLPTPAAPAESASSEPSRSTPRWAPIVIGGAAVVAAAIVLIAVLGDDSGGSLDADAVVANSALFVDTADGSLSGQTAAGDRPAAVVAGDGAVWVADQSARELIKLDAETKEVIDRVPVDDAPDALAFGDGRIWAASADGGAVYEVDPEADRVVAVVAVGSGPSAIAAGDGAVWVTDAIDGSVRRIDPRMARVTATTETAESLSGVSIGLGGVWATSADSGVLIRIDPDTARVIDSIPVGNEPSSVTVAGGAVWVSNPPDGTVTRIDPATSELRKVAVAAPGALAATADSLWVAQPQAAGLASIDLASVTLTGQVETGAPATAITANGDDLAVVTGASPSAHRGGTLRVVAGDEPDSVDPGVSFSLPGFALLSLTYEGMIRYAREPGPAGSELVPGLATSVPTPTDDGTSYSFQLRPGVRYSTGEEVDPLDFRTALERQYASSSGAAQIGVPLVGAGACARAQDRCDLSRGVEVDEQSRTVTYHLTEPDPAFLFVIALPFGAPVPADSPPIDAGRDPLPATGPYEVGGYVPGQSLDLVRNPGFDGATGPSDGFVDRMEVELGIDPASQVRQVDAGTADVGLDSPPPDAVPELLREDPLQTHIYGSPTDIAMALNTRRPPFDSLEARRAINLAVDRAAAVKFAGGDELARPSCQILPTGFPGYAPYCPYTAGASDAGVWRGPNVQRARELIAASGTAGASTLVATSADDPVKVRIARYFTRLLDRLGYRASLRIYSDPHSYYSSFGQPGSEIEAGTFGWIADYPAASAFFGPLFSCQAAPSPDFATNASGFCDPHLDARMRDAQALEGPNPAVSGPAWQSIDRAVTDQAPWVPLINPRGVDYVGSRVGNYQRSSETGALLDRIWVR